MKKILSAVFTVILMFSIISLPMKASAVNVGSTAGIVSVSSGRLNVRRGA